MNVICKLYNGDIRRLRYSAGGSGDRRRSTLVESNLVGLDSHGVVRIPQYRNAD